MTRTATLATLALVAFAATTASAQTHDHFARQRQEAVARQAAAQQQFSQQRVGGAHAAVSHQGVSHHGGPGHWGGPTTNHRFYNPSFRHGTQQNIQFYSVNPFGNPYAYGVPGYGFSGVGSPYYGAPYCGTGVYIHREIYLGR